MCTRRSTLVDIRCEGPLTPTLSFAWRRGVSDAEGSRVTAQTHVTTSPLSAHVAECALHQPAPSAPAPSPSLPPADERRLERYGSKYRNALTHAETEFGAKHIEVSRRACELVRVHPSVSADVR
jgi:hypothetical protein